MLYCVDFRPRLDPQTRPTPDTPDAVMSTGLPGSGMPTATVSSKEGYLAKPQSACTQLVKIDCATQTNIRCFSPQLCIDLVDIYDKLSDKQMDDEILRIYDDKSYVALRDTPRKKEFSLKQHFTRVLMTDGDALTHRLNNLTSHFSRHVSKANSQLEELKKNIVSPRHW